ncbi:MAG: hypothetical protein M1584_05605 [Deltaproteobacteria bacterium]|nr:hypothetical protein [Deltaproteobacteria bacterium]
MPHAVKTRDNFLKAEEKMKQGKRQKFVVGTGHGTATCQGPAFEYIHNLEFVYYNIKMIKILSKGQDRFMDE